MRESQILSIRLHRFGVWRSAVALVALAAIAAVVAWAVTFAASRGEDLVAIVLAVAAALAASTAAIAVRLLRVPAGVLSCTDGRWTFAGDDGVDRSGALSVAIDLGAFLLLRLDTARHARVWLPVQRAGLEREWHALRCAVYSPPPEPADAVPATSPPPE